MGNKSFLGQSAVEYLMTYGWMLLVVSVAGGTIYSIRGQQSIENVSGFDSNDIRISDFSLTQNRELQLLMKDNSPGDIEINSIELKSNNESAKIKNGPALSDLNENTMRINDLQRIDGSNNVDMEVTYSQGGLQNLTVSGSLTGNLGIKESYEMDYWWKNSWNSRMPVYIEYNGRQNLEDYQVKVELDTQKLISDSNMNENCEDLRFISSKNDVEYDYWIEEGCNTGSTEVWVEIPEINSAENMKFYAYFDNSEASSNSSANETMFIYDLHGEGHEAALNERAEYNVTEEYVDFTPELDYRGSMMYNKTPRPGFVAEFRHYAGGGSGADATYLSAYSTDSVIAGENSDNGDYKYILDEYTGNSILIGFDGSEHKRSADPNFDIDDSTWRDITVKFDGGDRHIIEASGDEYIDSTISSSKEDSGDYFGWGARTGGSNNYHRVKNLTVRKYVEPAPQTNVGSIQNR
ncbi:MAG: DUF2341 domain-containing protein [Candidatus Nanohaloarchaea archaeon]